MRILYHHRTRAEDAQGIHIEEIQRALRDLGHEVRESAIVPRGGDGPSSGARLLSRVAAAAPRGLYEWMEIASNLPESARLLAEIRAFRPDAIYERYSLHNAAGAVAAAATGVPLLLEVNAPLAEERAANGGLTFPRIAAGVEARIWRASTAIVAVSTPLRDRIVAAGVAADRVRVVPNAVRREMLAAPRDGAPARRRLGIPADAVVVGFTGWFRPWHGLERLLEGFADAGLERHGATVLLVGEGRSLPALREVVARRGLERAVRFAGRVDREAIAAHIAAFDIALQPAATPYASPMKLFEYMALGTAIVAVATPAIRETLTDGVDALLFDEGDADGMMDRVTRLVLDRPLRERLGAEARRTIERQGHFWDRNASRSLDHLARCEVSSIPSWRRRIP